MHKLSACFEIFRIFVQGDLIVTVNGLRIASTRMAVRVMKQAPDKFKVRVERSNKVKQMPAAPPQRPVEFRYNEDSFNIKVSSCPPC